MKLHELLPLKDFTRIKRSNWNDKFLVKSQRDYKPLVELDLFSIQIGFYVLSYDDLIAYDWEIVE